LRYTGPACRLCRREGMKLFLKGERCFSDKCAFERRSYPPGQHGRRRTKLSEYGLRLREKQKCKRIYGISEKQFVRYFEMATRMKGLTGDNLIKLLERRLDNVVYRMGFAVSRRDARQLVSHGHVMVNGKVVDVPSYLLRPGEVVEIKESSKNLDRVNYAIQLAQGRDIPSWLEVDFENKRGVFRYIPERSEVQIPVNETLIIELYSRG